MLSSATLENHMKICDRCKIIPSAHYINDQGRIRSLCCKCYVEEGNPPADWHKLCMEAYKRIKDAGLKKI